MASDGPQTCIPGRTRWIQLPMPQQEVLCCDDHFCAVGMSTKASDDFPTFIGFCRWVGQLIYAFSCVDVDYFQIIIKQTD